MFSIFSGFAVVMGLSNTLLRPSPTRTAVGREGHHLSMPITLPSETQAICPPTTNHCKRAVKVKLHRDSASDGCSHPVRMRISGRMADVHAELERLAALENVT